MGEVSLPGTQLETEAGAGSGQHDTRGIWWWCEVGRKECGAVRGLGLQPSKERGLQRTAWCQGTVSHHRSAPPRVGAKH